MISIHMAKRIAVAAILGAFVAAPAHAASITLNPSSSVQTNGTQFNIDILVSGLGAGESIGGVSLRLSYDPTKIQGVSYANDPIIPVVQPTAKMGLAQCAAEAVGNPLEPTCEFSSGFAGGNLDLLFLANDELDGAALKGMQGAGFVLSRVTFNAVGLGLSPLTLSNIVLSDSTGLITIPSQAVNGDVCVATSSTGTCQQTPAVPEPATLTLLGTGVSAFLVRRRRQKAESRA